jgi:hypothetical protein
MQRTKRITIDDREITIKELSVAQIKVLLDNAEAGEDFSVINLLFPDTVPALAIEQSTGISVKTLESSFNPSELKQIIDGVESLNPFFVNMIVRLSKIGKQVMKEKSLMSPAAD